MSATPRAEFDLVVIGAGVNGAGIARDAALRGLKVAVLEQHDMCSSTSAASSRLIHGGLRYLEYGEIPLVYESLNERRNLLNIAPHLVNPLRINIPIFAGAKRGPWLVRLGMLAYDLLSLGKAMPRHEMLNRRELEAAAPGLETNGLKAGARYFDAQVTFAERLVLENLLAARQAGATVLTWHKLTRMDVDSGRVQALEYENLRSRERAVLHARVVVNAGGPWVDAVLAKAADTAPLIGGTKGSHIVVSRFAGAPADAFYVEAAADGRPFFIIPWNGLFLIGTTDLRFESSLSEVRASPAEVDYLLSETNRVFPQAELTVADIHYAYAGVRPLPARDKGPESAITRKHLIIRNRAVADNLISIVGGKLTTYRSLAEQTVDRVGKLLERRLPECRTHDTLLPGAADLKQARQALTEFDGLSAAGAERLIAIYGSRATGIAELAAREPELNTALDVERSLLAAEVAFAFREEFAACLVDVVHRRMMLGLSADQGRPHYDAIARVAAAEQGWDDARKALESRELLSYSDSFRV